MIGQTKGALEGWLTSLKTKNELENLPIEWGRQPMMLHDGPFVLAYDGPRTHLGKDFSTWEYDATTDQLKEKRVGLLRYVLRLSFRAFTQDPDANARYYAERFKLLAGATTSIQYLNQQDMGLWSFGEVIDTDYPWSGRLMSQADVDVVLGVRAEILDPNYDGHYIDSVEVTHEQIIVDEYGQPVESEEDETLVGEESSTFTVTRFEEPE